MPDLFQTVFTVRKTFLERLADYFEAEEEPEESVQVFLFNSGLVQPANCPLLLCNDGKGNTY
jgi:hypothetical protein